MFLAKWCCSCCMFLVNKKRKTILLIEKNKNLIHAYKNKKWVKNLAITFLPIWSWMTQYRLTNVPLGYLLFIILWGKKLEKKNEECVFFLYVKWVFSPKICHFWKNKCFEKGKNIVPNENIFLGTNLTICVLGQILIRQKKE